MKWVPVLALLGTAALSLSALSQASTTNKKKPATKAVAAKAGSNRAKTRKAAHGRGRSKRAAAPSYQLHPDPERYQQIQQALADRGYFKGQVNGEWGDDSTDAMKRFQTDQKLDPDGKINALSLIDLGLGAKHEAGATAAVGAPHPASDASRSAPASTPPIPPAPSENTPPPN